MLALAVELLSGVYVATAYNDRDRGEWPPHPGRLFSALVATWATHERESDDGQSELRALRWLETLPPPEVLASSTRVTAERTVMPVFVPVNDVSLVNAPDRTKLDEARAQLATLEGKPREKARKDIGKLEQKLAAETAKALAAPDKVNKDYAKDVDALLLDRRMRQPRTFPAVVPEQPQFAFVWPELEVADEHRRGLARLMSRLVRLGHSSTLVRGFVADEAHLAALGKAVATHVEDGDDGELTLRWVSPGQLDRLEDAFALHRETEPRTLPARFVRYREGRRAALRTPIAGVFSDELMIFARVDGPRLPITSGVGIARQFRRALMSVAGTPTPAVISGHAPEGGPSDRAHLAIVPLPAVLGPAADGSLLGIAVVLPRELSAEDRSAVLRAIGKLEETSKPATDDARCVRLQLGSTADLVLRRDVWNEERRVTLRGETWTSSARRWASATPVALDRNPGDLHHPNPATRARAYTEAEASIREALTRVGLPHPIELDVLRSCVLPGTTKPRLYPRFPTESGRPQRVLVHVRLGFPDRVRGPILLGAGRYHGLGLFLPMSERS